MNVNHHLIEAAALAGQHSAPVTHLWSRVIGTVVMLAVIAGIYLLMWRGWRKRQQRQADVEPPQSLAEAWDAEHDPGDGFEAVYVSTTRSGDWLDRIAVHGFGNRSLAAVALYPHGIFIDRSGHGEPDISIPAEAVRDARPATGMAGKYLREEGIVVITWQHGDHVLDTGVKPRFEADRDELLRIAGQYHAVPATERPSE